MENYNTLIAIIGIILVLVFIVKPIFTNFMFNRLKKALPPISDTEREAIDAGTVSYERGLFKGKPDWHGLLNSKRIEFTKEEQAFIDGPTREVCTLFNDYQFRDDKFLPDKVWDYLKKNKFFSMVTPKEHGGLGFSATALSHICGILSTRSNGFAISAIVPNALGPAKLLVKFGTPKQRKEYLPKLITGEYVPCFALTGVVSGSDAASMRDVGILVKENGKIKIKANFSKRYITLGPIATLIGLAINIYDPDGLLGDDYPYTNPKTKHVGITVTLLKRNHKGLQIGNRHMIPAGFINGPIRGKDIMIDMDQVIGGKEYLGKGWVMLMACLGVGRAVSKPATATADMMGATYYTMYYSAIRKQFRLPIGKMEGVVEKLSDSIYLSYVNDCARLLSAEQVDNGENPAVTSAIIKYASTGEGRDVVLNCMDILAGKAICDGPSNVIHNSYLGLPPAITVEGANILTRTLITFAQGAIRAHPYLFDEVEALYMDDQQAARKKFGSLMTKHAGFIISNALGNIVHGLTRGIFMGTPSGTLAPSKYYRMVNLQVKQFALLSDIVLLSLGGKVKAKQILSGRYADILKNLYYAMATLKRYEDDNNPKLLFLLDYSIRRLCHENIRTMHGVIENLPISGLRYVLKPLMFPYSLVGLGMNDCEPNDAKKTRLVREFQKDTDMLDTVFANVSNSVMFDEIKADYKILKDAEPLYEKLKPYIKSQELLVTYERNWCDEAYAKGFITKAELKQLKQAEDVYYRQINVDEFEHNGKTHLGKVQTNLTA